nr:hypothetical protein [uncultured Flavobacterium sp.]
MKRKLFLSTILFVVIAIASCSGDDSPSSTQNTDTSQLMGKWIIYKAAYQNSEPTLYESNGTCGREILQFYTDGEVTETIYMDDDCNNGGMASYSWWVLSGGEIAFGAQNSYHHIVKVNGNDLVLDASEEAGYIKYFHKAE